MKRLIDATSSSVERDSSVPHVEQRSNPLMNLGPCLYASAVCVVEHDPKSLLPRALGMGRFYSPSCREGSFSETELPPNNVLGNSVSDKGPGPPCEGPGLVYPPF